MSRNYFGTDGVRGRANQYPMTAELALKLGIAAGQYFRRDNRTHRVVIGKDTRRSGYMLENALTAGLTSTGMDVFLLGPVPTPAVGILTRNMRADLGVMISASHNPAHDNGIKFFGPDGHKLSDEAELAIEDLIKTPQDLVDANDIGRAKRIDDGVGRYVESVKASFSRRLSLDGMKIVIDAANGAAYKTAPEVLFELGAEIIPIAVNPNGYNINKDCGSTAPANAAMSVVSQNADIGICLDGDADRITLIDELGHIIDGDQIMAAIAKHWMQKNQLNQNTLVATVMSNLGLERFMEQSGGQLIRTKVGDRYVVEEMRKHGYNLGGEQSGHIVMTDYATTGDGLLAALQFLAIAAETKRRPSELGQVFSPVPQKLVNVRFQKEQTPLDNKAVQASIQKAEQELSGQGRLLIRKSGTEPLIRIMAEADDETLMNQVVTSIETAVKKACE